MGQGWLLWEGCPGAKVGLCTAAHEERLGKLLVSLWRGKGRQFLVENIVPVSSFLRSPLEVSGQKGTAGAAAAPGRCSSPAGAVVTASSRVKNWALSFP